MTGYTRYTRHTSAVLYIVIALGCGSLGGPARSDDLPNAGVTGWHYLAQVTGTDIREPFVLCESGAEFHAPTVVRLSDGTWRMWYQGAAGVIGTASSSDGIYDWEDDGPITLPDPGPFANPSVAEFEGAFRMALPAADGSRIAFFSSADGTAWAAAGQLLPTQTWEAGAIGGPALFHDPLLASWVLYYEGGDRSAIGRAESADGSTWVSSATPLVTANEVRTEGWPVVEIGEPSAGLDTSRPGPPVYKMWFTGLALHGFFPFGAERSVGFAGSFDGLAWELFDTNPVLAEIEIEAPGGLPSFEDERAPSVLDLGGAYRMYLERGFDDATTGQTRACIALALTP